MAKNFVAIILRDFLWHLEKADGNNYDIWEPLNCAQWLKAKDLKMLSITGIAENGSR